MRLYNSFLSSLDINLEDLENMDKAVQEEQLGLMLLKAAFKGLSIWVLAKEVLEMVLKDVMKLRGDLGKKEDKEALEDLCSQGDCWGLFQSRCLLCLVE